MGIDRDEDWIEVKENEAEHIDQILTAFRKIYGNDQVDYWLEHERELFLAKIGQPWKRDRTDKGLKNPEQLFDN